MTCVTAYTNTNYVIYEGKEKVSQTVTLVASNLEMLGSSGGYDTECPVRWLVTSPWSLEKMAVQYLKLDQEHFLQLYEQFIAH
jgi:hypothetical protein